MLVPARDRCPVEVQRGEFCLSPFIVSDGCVIFSRSESQSDVSEIMVDSLVKYVALYAHDPHVSESKSAPLKSAT